MTSLPPPKDRRKMIMPYWYHGHQFGQDPRPVPLLTSMPYGYTGPATIQNPNTISFFNITS